MIEYEVGCIADLVSGQWTPSRSREPTKATTPRKTAPPSTAVTPQDGPLVRPKAPRIAFSPDSTVSPKGVPRKRASKLLRYRSQRELETEDAIESVVNDDSKAKLREDADSFVRSGKNKSNSTKYKPAVRNEYVNSGGSNEKRRKNERPEKIVDDVARVTVNDKLKIERKGSKKSKRTADRWKKFERNPRSEDFEAGETVRNEQVNSNRVEKKRRKNERLERSIDNVAHVTSNDKSKIERRKSKKPKRTDDGRGRFERNSRSDEFEAEDETVEINEAHLENVESKNKRKKRKLVSKDIRSDIEAESAPSKKKRKLNSETELTAKKLCSLEIDDTECSGNFSYNTADDTVNDENKDEQTVTDFQKAAQCRIEKKLKKSLKFESEERERTLFVGNIPISILKANHKKILKNIFKNYGEIECIRIRNVPVEDLKTKPKVAYIKKKFHPECSTVIAYIRFKDASSVKKSLVENNTVIEGNHIRVDLCSDKKSIGDSRKTLFLGNLPWNVDEESVRKLFEKCGEIKSLRVIRDKKTHVGKGFGFVNFEKVDGVELALTLGEEDLKINGKVLRIKRYSAHPNRDQEVKTHKNYSKNDGSNKALNKKFVGKKRDEQGNKIRKRDLLKNKDVENKPDQNLSDSFEKSEVNISKTDNSHSNFKGLVAKKKKKNKLNKGILKKKKISKILAKK